MTPSRSALARALPLVVALLAGLPAAAGAQQLEFQGEPKLAFTDSDNSKIAQTRRVAITSVVLEFQTKVSAEEITGLLSKRVLNRHNTFSRNTLAGFDPAMLQQAADKVHEKLVADLTAAGFEVVPQAEVEAQAAYQKLVQEMGWPQGYHWGNQDGNSILVAPSKLKLYVPPMAEQGSFSNVRKESSPYQGPTVGFGDRMKLGGASSYSAGREVEIAKALNAHVLKAWYLVGFGQATAETDWDSKTTTITGGGFKSTTTTGATQRTGATAQMYLRDEQTRIALRTPDGNTGYNRESSRKNAITGGYRPWDGDVVVRLDETVFGVADFLKDGGVQKESKQDGALATGLNVAAGLLSALGGRSGGLGDSSQSYTTQVDPAAFAQYSTELIGWVQPRLIQKLKP